MKKTILALESMKALAYFLLSSTTLFVDDASSFTVRTTTTRGNYKNHHHKNHPVVIFDNFKSITLSSALKMTNSNNDDDIGSTNNNGGAKTIIAGVLFAVFIAGSVLPLAGTLDYYNKNKGAGTTIADSVITRQDAPGKYQNVGPQKKLSLSRSVIQQKLNSIPVFYIVSSSDGGTTLSTTDIYLSYDDAAAANAAGTVKCTTLDQVMYPLVLKRGRMMMPNPTPKEIEKAEAQLLSNDATATVPNYRLIPSSKSVEQYKKINNGEEVASSDVPLFVADRLAFASSGGGRQLPLFLNQDDCVSSYERLRGGNSKLPEEPTIRTSSLLQTLLSMEKGTRPGLNQLSFYATENDLIKVDELRMK